MNECDLSIKDKKLSYYTTTKLAKKVGLSYADMNVFLLGKGIQLKSKQGYFPAAKYEYNYAIPFYVIIKKPNCKPKVLQMIHWTKVGRVAIENEIHSN